MINDTVFTNFTNQIFERFNPENNIFLIGVKNPGEKLKHTELAKNVHIRQIRSKEYLNFIDNLSFDVLVVHYMHDYKVIAVNRIKKNVKIVWLSWGGDIRETKRYGKNIYMPHTKQVIDKIYSPLKKKIRIKLRNFYYFLLTGFFPGAAFKKAVEKVDFCGTVIADEFDILKNELDTFRATAVPFSYGSIEDNVKHIGPEKYCDGRNIIIGNSIDAASNHFDGLYKLKEFDISDRDIIMPLNYSEGLEYKDLLIKTGYEQFGHQFKPMLKLLPPEEYLKVLTGCNVALMLHERQQAVGNITTLLWVGCKVFMSENSVVYKNYKRKGFKIYSFQAELNEGSINQTMSMNDIQENRRLLMVEYGQVVIEKKVKTLLNIVSGTVAVV